MNTPVAVALALASVVAYAVAAAMQHRVAGKSTATGGLRAVLTDAAWWVSTVTNALGALLHVAALAFGPLSLVQCLGALTVVLAVPIGAHAAGRRVTRAEWKALCLTATGFTLLIPLTFTTGSGGFLTASGALGVAATAFLAVPLALSVRHPALRAPAFAAASGVVSGSGSALTQTVLNADRLISWQTASVALPTIGLAMAGLLLSQAAYTGGLGTPLAILTLVNPFTATLIGVALLGERVPGGPWGAALALTGAVLTARGVFLLTRYSSAAVKPCDVVAVPSRAASDSDRPARAAVVSA
ncbi:MAG TPA: hypothetical protein VN520_12355 [Streptomyces sp.]|uniref:hypothetical protein n=1 Tax=Streptomyces sp. TaxID=1931 RepID=UPI002C7230B6|nr:hypothetical protein [Streptomyces sp.]HWU07153.1 hypothetical protein [Streptomyces sp.]